MPDQTTTHDLDADTAVMLRKLVDLQARAADLDSQIESIKAELRALPPGDFALDGRPALRIIPTRRFDVDKAAGLLNAEQRQAALVVSFNATEVKRHLTAVEIDECMVEVGKPKVVVL